MAATLNQQSHFDRCHMCIGTRIEMAHHTANKSAGRVVRRSIVVFGIFS